jgi:two-component system chemotaxis response regulator CheB
VKRLTRPIKVLIVDDSAFMRHTIARRLEPDPDIMVVGTAYDGIDALQKVRALMPDVVILDVVMPRMDGLTALQRIMAELPRPVIMLSSLTTREARTTIQALTRGAIDVVAKPESSTQVTTVIDELIEKIKVAAGARVDTPRQPRPILEEHRLRSHPRPFHEGSTVIIVGASTGGPPALQQLLSELPASLPAAIVVVQHMPAGFTSSLAQRLNEISEIAVQEASDGDRLAQGLALVAPGDFHLRFKGDRQVALDQGPRRNHVRPAVDVTMESAAEVHGSSTIGVILTGMGSDGVRGARRLKAVGGTIIVEHESTCVVYGMPRGVVEAGLADRIVPLHEIAAALQELVAHGTVGI